MRLALGLAISPVILLLLFRLADKADLGDAIRTLAGRWDLMALFIAAYSSAFLLRAIAWRSLLPAQGVFRLFNVLQASLFANHILPLKAGEVLRPLLAIRLGARPAEATTSALLARLLDMFSLLLLAAPFLMVTAPFAQAMFVFILPVAIVLFAGAAFLWLRSALPLPLPHRLLRTISLARESLRGFTVRRMALAASLTLPSWVLEASAVLVAAHVMGVELSLTAAIGITAFTILFQFLQITPGGLGVYEASMTGALIMYGVPFPAALALAVLTHGLKFLYSFTVGLGFTIFSVRDALRGSHKEGISPVGARGASRLEIGAARLWNIFNEGRPFTVVFTLGILALVGLPHVGDFGYWLRLSGATLAIAPLLAIFYRFAYPLKLRITLWVFLGVFVAVFRFVDLLTLGLILVLYFGFTVILWGTVYYRWRIGMPWTNFTRFWKLVLENPDTTSGNFLEQAPKLILLAYAAQYLVGRFTWEAVFGVEIFVLGIAVASVLVHQWYFTWAPSVPLSPTRDRNTGGIRHARRVIAIVIDGCRADLLRKAATPFIDRLRREGAEFTDMHTVYPARTVTCFSSMLTGASPGVHGMVSNFIPRRGVRCDSVFAALRRCGLKGTLVGIAHLLDAFDEKDIRTVSAVAHNDEIDPLMVERAKRVLLDENPDLLVLQLISVDQTGHARGSYNREYLAKIETTDAIIGDFLGWCEEGGFLEDATVIIMADHGQGIGIGGHGHASPSEVHVPCILWGAGVPASGMRDEARSIVDVAPTICYLLGAMPPANSTGQVLTGPGIEPAENHPLAVIIPARNEALNLPYTLRAIPRHRMHDLKVIVVDDGSTDGTGELAREYGAEIVIRHEQSRGLGAALRTGLEAARRMDARAAIYIDADGEYDPGEIPELLAPLERGEADYVLGSRFRGKREGQRWTRLIGNVAFTTLLSVAAGRLITDGQTGFRAFSRRAMDRAEIIHDYNYAQVLTLDLLKKGMRLAEAPITYRRRRAGRSFIRAEYLWRVPLAMARQLLRG